MPINSLTTQAGFKIGPIVLETLIKHYFDRIKNDAHDGKSTTNLRQDEILYDEAFSIVKAFLEASSHHTVEEVQGFSNTRTPSPPWVRVVRLLVPMSCCDDAAGYLTKALGGEEVARRVVGGVKWWQVRGVNGVDAQWITAKKDWREAKRRHKMREKPKYNGDTLHRPQSPPSNDSDPCVYEEEMDDMRCILYSHGGGYYFGSVDQERYSMQRHARKINGRVFAVNYRLAPQYPFPCAIHDLIAAYLFLIRPPPGSSHRPVKPAHIIIAGDSAGGGISLALLQVIRDVGLPMPAGGFLISPWCDLTHSFPSIHTNTATDVIPAYGLSLQKPSALWPPPSDEMTSRVHASLRSRIRQTLRIDDHDTSLLSPPILESHASTSSAGMPVDIGATTCLPPLNSINNQTITMVAQSGETLKVDQQVHLYTQNSLLAHPLISPALSYLGGLPPLLIIASDKEVLRDEIIYAAHKAANPEKYPLKDEVRALYPPLVGIENRFKATRIHLQVYDDAAHILPVLFSFTTPGKFCYRAIATFCKHVTAMDPNPQSPINSVFSMPTLSPRSSDSRGREVKKEVSLGSFLSRSRASTLSNVPRSTSDPPGNNDQSSHQKRSSRMSLRRSLRRSLSAGLSHAASAVRRPWSRSNSVARGGSEKLPTHETIPPMPNREDSNTSSDVGGPRFGHASTSPSPLPAGARTAGDGIVYSETPDYPSWKEAMIRERVSTQGVIRPLEPETALDAFQVPQEIVGVLSELAVRRYLDGKSKFDKKFASVIKSIEKDRHQNLELSKKDPIRNISVLQTHPHQNEEVNRESMKKATKKGVKEGLMTTSGSWSWAWALDGDERPPPSSIVSRRDTEEARRLARIADLPALPEDDTMSANHLWSVAVNFLTATPDKNKPREHDGPSRAERVKTRLSRLIAWERTSPDMAEGTKT